MAISKINVGDTEHDLIASGLTDTSTEKVKLDATNIAYGTCSTAAATAAKVITISGNTNWALTAGSTITIKFSYTNTAKNPTFNVNNTGAKSVWYNTALITTTSSSLSYAGYKDRPAMYVYDGTQYVFLGWAYDTNTTYTNASLGQGYGTCSTAEATVAKVVTLASYALTVGGIVAVQFTYAVPASSTMNINSKGAKSIYHKGSAITAGVIKAGDTATFIYDGTQYHLISIDRDDNATYSAAGSSLGLVKSGGDVTISDGVITVNDDSHNHTIDNIDNLQSSLDAKVPTTRTVNGKALSANISLTASDVSARASTWVPALSDLGVTATAAELNLLDGVTATTAELNYVDGVTSNIQTQLNGKVPTTRKVNNKALSADISLTAEDVGARSSTWVPTASDVGAVPTTRTINSKALSSNITLSASDVSAVPTSRTVNEKALSSDITLTAEDVGAAPLAHNHDSLMPYNNTPRQASADIASEDTGGLTKFLSTSSMTENKPMADGHIVHCHWDSTGGWDGQLFIPCSNSGHMQYRTKNGGTWEGWRTLVDSVNYSAYVGSGGSGGSGMSREFDSGIMSKSSYTTSGSASKFYIVSVKHTSTSRVHSFVVDYRTVYNGGTRTYYEGNASTDAIYFYVTISSLKPTFNAGANYTLYHICGYY